MRACGAEARRSIARLWREATPCGPSVRLDKDNTTTAPDRSQPKEFGRSTSVRDDAFAKRFGAETNRREASSCGASMRPFLIAVQDW
jgi:hypothetical protein